MNPASQTVQRRHVLVAGVGALTGIGHNSLKSWPFMAERPGGAANPAGVVFRMAGFDNSGSPRERLNALKLAMDHGFRFIVRQPRLRKMYLLNQNHAHGQPFATDFRSEMARQSPDAQVVGDDLHPPFHVDHFAPCVKRFKASGAQALLTGNRGADLRKLMPALQTQGLALPLFTCCAGLQGTPAALAALGERAQVHQVASSHCSQEGPVADLATAFRQQHGEDLVVHASCGGMPMPAHAKPEARSTDARLVAAQLSCFVFESLNGPVRMRSEDHQLKKGVYVARWQKVCAQYPRSGEATACAFAPVQYLDSAQISGPPRCKMQRPLRTCAALKGTVDYKPRRAADVRAEAHLRHERLAAFCGYGVGHFVFKDMADGQPAQRRTSGLTTPRATGGAGVHAPPDSLATSGPCRVAQPP